MSERDRNEEGYGEGGSQPDEASQRGSSREDASRSRGGYKAGQGDSESEGSEQIGSESGRSALSGRSGRSDGAEELDQSEESGEAR